MATAHSAPARLLALALLLMFLASSIPCSAEPDAVPASNPAADKPGHALSESRFFAALNLEYPGLEQVKRSVQAADWPSAKKSLAAYFRGRHAFYDTNHPFSPDLPPATTRELTGTAERAVAHSGEYAAQYRLPDGQLDLRHAPISFRERLYYWETLAKSYEQTHDERIARAWIELLHAYIAQVPFADGDAYWRTMHIGIQLRSAFPVAFRSFLRAPAFTDEDVYLFLKRMLEQTRYLRQVHNLTSNQLTFEMAGLYTSGVMFPEFKEAADWRHFACQTALADLQAGWLPDGMSIELSPGYGQFFSNYLVIYDLAKQAGRLDQDGVSGLLSGTERLYELYVRIMTPDRLTPATNDNDPVYVPSLMQKALQRFPDNPLFKWAATEGKAGTPPPYTSLVLLYAGFAAMRSDWSRQANMLYFDFGPLGYRHAHQDKLSLTLWAYGRQILFDSGRGHYDSSPPRMQNYALDTFSHSTVLVDHRPQRRPWYTDPHPRKMPYQQVKDYQWQSDGTTDYAAGVYDDAYGLPGESDADPFKTGSNFKQGWVHPATHHRRVLFYKPDLFIVVDTLVASDDKPHDFDARWQLATTATSLASDGLTLSTADPGKPNLEIVPLDTAGLTVKATSAQQKPELLGWNAADTPRPATTLQHLKSGSGTVRFITLLLPLKPGEPQNLATAKQLDPSTFKIDLRNGRRLRLTVPADVGTRLEMHAMPATTPAGG